MSGDYVFIRTVEPAVCSKPQQFLNVDKTKVSQDRVSVIYISNCAAQLKENQQYVLVQIKLWRKGQIQGNTAQNNTNQLDFVAQITLMETQW